MKEAPALLIDAGFSARINLFQEPVTRRIDYIFVSGAWKTQQYAVLSDARNCHYPSDHLPVLARVE